MQEIYVSIDIEADGPIPGPHSMLSLGAAAYDAPKKKLLNSFSINFKKLPGAVAHPVTEKWWRKFPEAYTLTRENQIDPKEAMQRFANWANKLPARPIMTSLPVTFDFMFVHWYFMRFLGESPFSFIGLDLRTLAYSQLNLPFKDCVRSNFPEHWFDELPHTHVALDDAIEQGALFCNMLNDLKSAKSKP